MTKIDKLDVELWRKRYKLNVYGLTIEEVCIDIGEAVNNIIDHINENSSETCNCNCNKTKTTKNLHK